MSNNIVFKFVIFSTQGDKNQIYRFITNNWYVISIRVINDGQYML